jgi:GNAT superfamily N-acetyltransferase
MEDAQNIRIFPIAAGDPGMNQVEQLFRQLYDSEKEHGVSVELIEGGEKIWRKSIEKLLGRFAQIIVAADGDVIAGFSYGSIRMMPAYFGGIITGYWEAMIIRPEYRKLGLGDKMTCQLIEWWREKGAVVLEGERLITNESARKNFERLGFKNELIKYRRVL